MSSCSYVYKLYVRTIKTLREEEMEVNGAQVAEVKGRELDFS
jgi:hypothetical protein